MKKIVFPVAGMGTRFLPYTKNSPKELIPILNKPAILKSVEEAIEAGFEEFLFVISKGKESVFEYFQDNQTLIQFLTNNGKDKYIESILSPIKGRMEIVYQDQPLGLGHAISLAEDFCEGENFGVMLCDDVMLSEKSCMLQLKEIYNQFDCNVIGTNIVEMENVSKYGVVKYKDENSKIIESFVEKPSIEDAPSNSAIVGRYIFKNNIFEALKKTKPGNGGEIQITDAMEIDIQNTEYRSHDLIGERFDCGSVEGWIEAQIAFGLNDDALRPLVKKIINKYK